MTGTTVTSRAEWNRSRAAQASIARNPRTTVAGTKYREKIRRLRGCAFAAGFLRSIAN